MLPSSPAFVPRPAVGGGGGRAGGGGGGGGGGRGGASSPARRTAHSRSTTGAASGAPAPAPAAVAATTATSALLAGATIAAGPVLYAKAAPPHVPAVPAPPPAGQGQPKRPQTVPSSSAPGLLGQPPQDQRRRTRPTATATMAAASAAHDGRPLRESRAELRAREASGSIVQDLLREIKGLQAGFAQSLEGNMPWLPQVEQQRQHIRRQYLSLLFGFPREADLSLVDNHWMQTTHAVIARYRAHPALKAAMVPTAAPAPAAGASVAPAPGTKSFSRGGKNRTSSSSAAAAAAGTPAGAGLTQEQRALVKRFAQFLAAEIAQYQQLQVRLALSSGLTEVEGYLPWLSNGQFTGPLPALADDDPDRPPTAQDRQRKLAMFVKGLIFLGDLERYREMYSPARPAPAGRAAKGEDGSGSGGGGRRTRHAPVGGAASTEALPGTKFEKAREYYDTARLVMPENGNPFNQLATISTYLRDRFASTYYFLRALAVKESFVTARGNLQATLKGPLEAHRPGDSDEGAKAEPSEKALQKDVVVVLAMLLLRTAFDPALAQATLGQFRALVASRALSAEVGLHTLVSFLAVHWDARLTRPAPRSADAAKAGPKVDAEVLALEVVLGLITALFETATADLVETLSVQQLAALRGDGSLLDDNDDGRSGSPPTGNNLDRYSPHLSAVLRRSLASLRVAAKWVRAHQDYLARVLSKHEARGAADAPVVGAARATFAAYADLANALAVAFPAGDLCPLEGPLEEDLELRGFGPLRKLFPASTPVATAHPKDGHPNEELFMRVWDLHHDVLLLVGMESSSLFIRRGRFAVVPDLLPAGARASAAQPSLVTITTAATATAGEPASFAQAPFALAQDPRETADDGDDIEIVVGGRRAAAVDTAFSSPGGAGEIMYLPPTHGSSTAAVEEELNFAEMDLEDDPVDAAMRAALGDSDEEFDSDEEAQLGMTMSMHGWGEVEERILWPPASARKAAAIKRAASPHAYDAPPRTSGITALDLLQQLGSSSALNDVQPAPPAFAGSPSHFGASPLSGARGDSIWGATTAPDAQAQQADHHRSRTSSLAPAGWGGALESGTVSPSTGFGLPLADSWTRQSASTPHNGLGNGGFGHGSSPFGQQSQQQQQQGVDLTSADVYAHLAHQQNAFGQLPAQQRSSVPGVPGAPYGPPSGFAPPGLASHYPPQPLVSPITNGTRSPWG